MCVYLYACVCVVKLQKDDCAKHVKSVNTYKPSHQKVNREESHAELEQATESLEPSAVGFHTETVSYCCNEHTSLRHFVYLHGTKTTAS